MFLGMTLNCECMMSEGKYFESDSAKFNVNVVLRHVDLLLGNDHGLSNYVTASVVRFSCCVLLLLEAGS
jgi:hypothetical protein